MSVRERDLLTRLIRTRPLLIAAALFLTGCALEYALAFPRAALWVALALPLSAAALLPRPGRRWVAPLLILAMLPLGALRFAADWRALAPLPEQSGVQLSGRISQTPVWNAETERTVCALSDVRIDGVPVDGRLRLYLRGDPALLQAVSLAQEIRCEARVWRAREASNPGQFNFSNHLRLNGLRGYATAEIEEAALTPPAFRAADAPERIREALGARIDRRFPENAAIARAFLLGDRSRLSEEDRESYSRSGAAHLLAISGMHVSALAFALNLLFGRFLGRNRAFALTLALLAAYGALIGFFPSLTRAILMFAVFGFAPVAGRYSDAPTRLAASMLLYLFLRPVSVLESGFILSYGASAGILLLSAPLARLVHAERFLRVPAGVGLRALFVQRLPRWALRSLLVTAAAQIAILPAVIHFFGAQPLWSFAVNLVAVPLAMAGYLLSIPSMLPGLAPLAAAGDFLFGLLTRCVTFFGNLPLSALRVARFPLWLVLLCAASCFLASDLSRLPERLRRWLPLFVLPAVLLSNACAQLSTRGLSAVFLDAGQADCAVLRTEGHVYLIDTGDAYTPAADYLSTMNYAVDGVFLSHPHADHAGGLRAVLEYCTPKRVYISANWPRFAEDEGVREALNLARSRGAEIVPLSAGDEIRLSDQTLLQVLSPAAGFSANSANNDSLILHLRYGRASALFCGDADARTVAPCAPDADLLKVAHHGGADALSPELLAAVSPSVAIVSVGENNYGHPAEATLELLAAAGARTVRTDRGGAVFCRMQADGALSLRTYLNSEG